MSLLLVLACTAPSTPAVPAAPLAAPALNVDADIVTIVRVTWPADDSVGVVEYRFETEAWRVAPTVAPGEAVLLGLPSETEVEVRRVSTEGDPGDTAIVTTGELPEDLPLPTVVLYDEQLALDAEFAMISVSAGRMTLSPPYWVEIFDREGRVVWYKEVADDMFTLNPNVSLDGTHIWYEAEDILGFGSATQYVSRRTLDGRWSQTIEAAGMGQAVTEGPEGSFFFELRRRGGVSLERLDADGTMTSLWDCGEHVDETFGLSFDQCYMNALSWSPERNSVLTSMFESNTTFEIDLATNAPVRQMGQLTEGGYTFSPPESVFDYQHQPTFLPNGNLLASTHIIGEPGTQVAAEYVVDDDARTLTRVWSYVSTDRWATQAGEATRLPNGNTLQGYGQDGAAREVTSEGATAWEVAWNLDHNGYRLVGHLSFIEDLYALNVGPE